MGDLRVEDSEERPEASAAEIEKRSAQIAEDWRKADLSEADQALCRYAEKLTLKPATMAESDVQELRGQGFDDVAIHDAIQVVSYFNYINRIADAVHVELEPEMPPYPSGR